MTDIVERLRAPMPYIEITYRWVDAGSTQTDGLTSPYCTQSRYWVIALEAADEIDRLRAENERLEAENEKWREQDDAIRAEFGGKRDGRPTIECLQESFAAKWSEEDTLFQATLDKKTEELRAENERLQAALRKAFEVYAGSEGFIPETAGEGYQQQIIKQMVACIGAALEEQK